jgi:hypothetical protein
MLTRCNNPVFVALAFGLALSVGLRGEPSLDSYRGAHETKVRSLGAEHLLKSRELLKIYGRSLDGVIESLQKAGDPDPVVSAMAEKRRFESEGTVPDTDAAGLPGAVTRLRASYRKAVAENAAAKRRRVAAVNAEYLAILDRLMQKLTAEGKLDLALNAKAEKKRVAFIVADAESRISPPERRAPVPVPRSPSRGPSRRTVKRTINVTGSEITRGKWRSCLKVKAGTKITVTAEPVTGMSQAPYSEDSFRIREGKNGREYAFDTKGLFVESYITTHKTLTFTAAEDEDLYVMPKQENRFRLSVILAPAR